MCCPSPSAVESVGSQSYRFPGENLTLTKVTETGWSLGAQRRRPFASILQGPRGHLRGALPRSPREASPRLALGIWGSSLQRWLPEGGPTGLVAPPSAHARVLGSRSSSTSCVPALGWLLADSTSLCPTQHGAGVGDGSPVALSPGWREQVGREVTEPAPAPPLQARFWRGGL